MIVPQYWAEATRQHRQPGKQRTVRRFGWSETSQAEADAMAQSRAEEALQRWLAGDKIVAREPKVAYNGAAGVPIREEVLSRHGTSVVTRNAYGAHCLNTPHALFADIDFEPRVSGKQLLAALIVSLCLSIFVVWWSGEWKLGLSVGVVSAPLVWIMFARLMQLVVHLRGGEQKVARNRLEAFLHQHPHWNVRVYETPAGLRLLATHQPFAASDPQVAEFFRALRVDPVYVRMCLNQNCFRARLTAKPWRIGIASHMRPRPGVWPVKPERMAERDAWIRTYETQAAGYAACRYVESLGSGRIHADIRPVMELHDQEARALRTELAIA
ncbi:MAG: hypothetical protein JNM18_25945 [Planctomycetaceae bacterium]|nr:hypothetical protein [Planctomycetaceae bacterium]